MRRINAAVRRVLSFLFLIVEARQHNVLVAAFEAGHELTQPARVARLVGKPLCVIVHSNIFGSIPQHWPGWPIARTLDIFAGADRLIFVSNGIQKEFLRHCADRLMPPTTAIPNGIDVSALESEVLKGHVVCGGKGVRMPSEPFFVSIGRLSPEKGFDRLIQAHAIARRVGRWHMLLIAGGGSKETLQSLASTLGVADSVLLLGHCSSVKGLLKHAYGFCLSSRYEGHSLALAEAAAAGTPCIAMDCVAGPKEILEGGRYGDLVPSGDVQALAQAMVAHLRDPEPLRDKARRSHANRARLDKGGMIKAYSKILADLAATKRRTQLFAGPRI